MNTPQQLHIPVLLDAVLDLLNPAQGETYLDLTAGYGGHAKEVIARIGAENSATLVDRDENATKMLATLFPNAWICGADFSMATRKMHSDNDKFDMILLDLGVSSPQLDQFDRGFSFRGDGDLDMRMDQRQTLTAAEIVNHYSEKEIFRILTEYGEESPRMASKIAHAIVVTRKKNPFKTTTDLAEIVKKVKGGWGKIHPATQTFQAIRIAVNDELGQLERTLPLLPDLLNPSGRLAIISFHSLEDRIVKKFLKDQCEAGYESTMRNLTKHPISGDMNDVNNPRARSAKLRAAVKIK